MNTSSQLPELQKFVDEIKQLSVDEQQTIFRQLTQFGETLQIAFDEILGKLPLLQQNDLTADKRQDHINSIQHVTLQSKELVSQWVHLMYSTPLKIEPLSVAQLDTIDKACVEELRGLHALIVDDDLTQRKNLLNLLEPIGIHCTEATIDTALTTLHAGQHKKRAYQVIIIGSKQYGHHLAYLSRAIRENNLLSHIMTSLVLPHPLLDYEKEQANFDGFSCILSLAEPQRLPFDLAHSWQSWAEKITVTDYPESLDAKNKILIVEDDLIAQKAAAWQLKSLGYEVDTAADGYTALKLLGHDNFDLVLMDIGLPDISGLEVTAKFRKRENNQHHTPVIGLTLYALGSDQATGLQAGMDEYLVKPLSRDHLQAILQRWVMEKKDN
jgi:CheY-like chemotaxis protein